MNNELITQYAQIWRVFDRLVNDFDAAAWLSTGRKAITPARLSWHILQSARYYLQDRDAVTFPSGKPFDGKWDTAAEADLPSKDDIRRCAKDYRRKTEAWLAQMDLSAPNTAFPWAGESQLGVAIFVLKHMTYHMGELSSLLNEAQGGNSADNYVIANEEKD